MNLEGYKEFSPKAKNCLEAIKKFIKYYNDEEGVFMDHDGNLTIGQKFEECMEEIEDYFPGTLNKNWKYYSEDNEDGFTSTYYIIWAEKGELKEFSFEDDGPY